MNEVWLLESGKAREILNKLEKVRVDIDSKLINEPGFLDNYAKSKSILRIEGEVGIISIGGVIIESETMASLMSFFGASAVARVSIDNAILQATADESIREVRFDINSPGGIAKGARQTFLLARNINKPTSSLVSDMCASGAYYIAVASDKIYSQEDSIIGSIGVIQTAYDFSKALEKNGIKVIDIIATNSPRKGFNPAKPEDIKQTQELLDDILEVFVQSVAEGRNTSVEDVINNYGQGGVFIGRKAKEIGMIDNDNFFMESTKNNQKDLTINTSCYIDKTAREKMTEPKKENEKIFNKEDLNKAVIEATKTAKEGEIKRISAIDELCNRHSEAEVALAIKAKADGSSEGEFAISLTKMRNELQTSVNAKIQNEKHSYVSETQELPEAREIVEPRRGNGLCSYLVNSLRTRQANYNGRQANDARLIDIFKKEMKGAI